MRAGGVGLAGGFGRVAVATPGRGVVLIGVLVGERGVVREDGGPVDEYGFTFAPSASGLFEPGEAAAAAVEDDRWARAASDEWSRDEVSLVGAGAARAGGSGRCSSGRPSFGTLMSILPFTTPFLTVVLRDVVAIVYAPST